MSWSVDKVVLPFGDCPSLGHACQCRRVAPAVAQTASHAKKSPGCVGHSLFISRRVGFGTLDEWTAVPVCLRQWHGSEASF